MQVGQGRQDIGQRARSLQKEKENSIACASHVLKVKTPHSAVCIEFVPKAALLNAQSSPAGMHALYSRKDSSSKDMKHAERMPEAFDISQVTPRCAHLFIFLSFLHSSGMN